jgi:integrase
MRVTEITTPRIERYIEERRKRTANECQEKIGDEDACPKCGSANLKPGAKNGTINRELPALKRILNLGAQRTPPKVDRVPYIPMLKENDVRKGFFEHEDFLSLRDALPSYLQRFVTFAHKTGWRISEVTGLKWSQIDAGRREGSFKYPKHQDFSLCSK